MTDGMEGMFGVGPVMLGEGRDVEEQITVRPPDGDNRMMVWFKNADGECTFELNADERRWLIKLLQRGLD